MAIDESAIGRKSIQISLKFLIAQIESQYLCNAGEVGKTVRSELELASNGLGYAACAVCICNDGPGR